MAIFKIWIQFEKTISDLFERYILGEYSASGFCPQRLLSFDSLSQYKGLSMRPNEKYTDYLRHAEEKSKLLFHQDSNPFDTIFTDLNYGCILREVKVIRNYIAHESVEAKNKFQEVCLKESQKKEITPNDFLKQLRIKEAKINYLYYVEGLSAIAQYCENPLPKANPSDI